MTAKHESLAQIALLEHRYGISHTTVQFEHVSCAISETGCAIPVVEQHQHHDH